MTVLEIATWNVNSGFLGEAGDKIYEQQKFSEYLKETVSELQPDVLFLQEFPFPTHDENFFIRLLQEQTVLTHAHYKMFSPSHLDAGLNLGLVIASKHPMANEEFHVLPVPAIRIKGATGALERLHSRGVLTSRISVGEISLALANVHLPPFSAISRDPGEPIFKELRNGLFSILKRLGNDFVIGGDFNCESLRNLDGSLLERLHGRENIFGPTRDDGRRTDNIVTSSGFTPLDSGALRTLSDHSWCRSAIQSIADQKAETTLESHGPAIVRILHLSDLHFGPGAVEDSDWKSPIEDAERESRSHQLRPFLSAIDPPPTFIVLTGDFTNAHREAGFVEAKKLVDDLIRLPSFPGRERIAVTPGNHDVKWRTPDGSGQDRWALFMKYFGDIYARPHFHETEDAQEIVRRVGQQLNERDSVVGAVRSSLDPRTGQRSDECFPFILDRQNKVLIYLFNSASVSGSAIKLSERAEGGMQKLREFVKTSNDPDVLSTFNEVVGMKYVDASRINPSEINLFRQLTTLFRRRLGDEYNEYLKVAGLHHHLSTIFGEEVKKFETTINAGLVKRELHAAGFNLVLHGHKHWPEVFVDTAITNGGSLNIISGSTIGGWVARPKGSPGFFIIDADALANSLKVYFVPLSNENPATVLTEALRKDIFSAELNARRGGTGIDGGRLTKALQNCREKIEASFKTPRRLSASPKPDKAGGTGWNNFYNTAGVSVLGTAFSIEALSALGRFSPAIHSRRTLIRDYLFSQRRQNGGWSSTSAGEPGQPLETAIVLTGLANCIAPEDFESLVGEFETFLGEGTLAEFSSNYLCDYILRFFFRFRPKSPFVHTLATILQNAECHLFLSGAQAWSATNAAGGNDNTDAVRPSVAHTALVLSSLSRASSLSNGAVGREVDLDSPCVNWLMNSSWDPEVIQVRQRAGSESIVNLTTDCICVQTLVELGIPVSHPKIMAASNAILKRQTKGVWSGHHQAATGWATLDSVSALLSIRNSPPNIEG